MWNWENDNLAEGTEQKDSHFLYQNRRWVEKLRHSNVSHIFYVRKLLCIAQRHGGLFFFFPLLANSFAIESWSRNERVYKVPFLSASLLCSKGEAEQSVLFRRAESIYLWNFPFHFSNYITAPILPTFDLIICLCTEVEIFGNIRP